LVLLHPEANCLLLEAVRFKGVADHGLVGEWSIGQSYRFVI
jgi:hypothetical protein